MEFKIKSTGFLWALFVKTQDEWYFHNSYANVDAAKRGAEKLAKRLGLELIEVPN